ncbi:NAD kinase [Magnetospira sp. QH-2]|uniref:NAD kinase n=1 Tax=Magnetospira sp. (strain QH-2) TaxID=1288970 RepID=UPI0003E81A55|nr:NAD kinase [Magnetospira sp. QH-2]CCQ74088.1 Putative inorganic polyphosphate/ATP-NAD kinase (Poly(P)/ATP NAD kinase) [Magnetospira sp. QH-2]
MPHPEFKIAFAAARQDLAQKAKRALEDLYSHVPQEEAEIIVALGGDGFMLHALHNHMERNIPIYGMNKGTVGFMMNSYRVENLMERLAAAESYRLHPLRMRVRTTDGQEQEALAINEVSLLRQSRMAAKLRIHIDGVARMEELICDGAMVATPAGSTAYNLSVYGPILPLGSDLLALTPISAFRPRRWRGAILPRTAVVTLEVLDADLRPVSATADWTEVRHVSEVRIFEDPDTRPILLFDPEHNLEERILKEQFQP